jgi:hypothetical protein
VISLSALLFTQLWWVRVLLLLVALGVTGHIVTLKGRGRQRIPES